jgi:hypothetical protein
VAIEALDSPLTPLEFATEFYPKLASAAKNYRLLLHSFAA